MNSAPKPDNLVQDQTAFRLRAGYIARLAKDENLVLTPFVDPALPHFSALPADRRAVILDRLLHLRAAAELVRQEGALISSAKLIWAYLKNIRHTVPADLMACLTDEDCVDFYGPDHQLVFANLTFFRATSYSLEQLYCLPWTHLYVREGADIQPALIELCERLVSPQSTRIIDASHLPAYVCNETLSPERRTARVQPRFCAPVFARGENAGYLWANRAVLITP